MDTKKRFFSFSVEGIKPLLPAILFFVMIGCSQQGLEIKLTNSLDQPRPDAQVVIHRDSLLKYEELLPQGAFEIVDTEQHVVPYQLDDLNGDGQWDELALVYSLPAGGSSSLFLRSVSVDAVPTFNDRAQVWFAQRDSATGNYNELHFEMRPEGYHRIMTPPFFYQFEGPGWENDNVGFRMYFDERNGFDIWGKRTDDLVLQDVGIEDDYHSLADWGMDVLHVGNSLGAGSIAAKSGDQVRRLMDTKQEVFEEVADGPVRAIFELTYQGWQVGASTYSVRERISIWAGANGYQNEVALVGGQDSLNLVAGIVTSKLDGEPEFGKNEPFKYLMTYGSQSANGANLGMALVSDTQNFVDYGSIGHSEGSVDSTAYIEMNLTSQQPVNYRFVTGWETGNSNFGQQQAFKDEVLSTGQRMQNPVKVHFYK